jgi:FAD/FMN-containing dehydrogenase
MATQIPSRDVLSRLAAIVGEKGAVDREDDIERYLRDPRDRYRGRTPLLLRPGSVSEVSAILALAYQERVAIVPQGGNTGLVGGQCPSESGTEVLLSLERINRIRSLDPIGNSITAEAGATLKSVQDAAAAADRLFPLSLGSEGSCQIGGNLATNAGGVHVLRHGSARDLALGIEAVFAGGKIWNGLKALRKDNTGYDLKSLLIGSEGTLAIITAATLKLFPRPAEIVCVFAGLRDLDAVAELFSRILAGAGPLLTAFELLPRIGLDGALAHVAGTRDPLAAPYPWYALFEVSSPEPEGRARALTLPLLEQALADGIVRDAAIAASGVQAKDFWRLREVLPEAQKFEGGSIKHDISVPVAAIPRFIIEASAEVERLVPGARPVPFGHFGDGNIHFNVSQPKVMDNAAFIARSDDVTHAVHAIVLELGGSISAEHGIGRMKAGLLETIKEPVELEMMRRIKAAFDPRGILNPGKVISCPSPG